MQINKRTFMKKGKFKDCKYETVFWHNVSVLFKILLIKEKPLTISIKAFNTESCIPINKTPTIPNYINFNLWRSMNINTTMP